VRLQSPFSLVKIVIIIGRKRAAFATLRRTLVTTLCAIVSKQGADWGWWGIAFQGNQCLKVLTMSIWNPPPGNRKLHGDLFYLYVVTMEQKHYHITANYKGFYVNQ